MSADHLPANIVSAAGETEARDAEICASAKAVVVKNVASAMQFGSE